MGKRTEKPPLPAAPKDDEDPIWGNLIPAFFGLGEFATPPAAASTREDKPAPRKPARKRSKA
jgi:hypothetical protein